MVTINDDEHCQRLAYSLWNQAVNGENTDATLQYGGSTFAAHLCVIQSYPVFLKHIGSQDHTEFTSIDANVFQKILKFLYTGDATFPEESIAEIQDFALKYKLENLYCMCHKEKQKMDVKGTPTRKRKKEIPRSLKCLECKETFNEPSELSKHYEKHGNEAKANFCKTCGIRFTEDILEQDHNCYLRYREQDLKSMACTYCLQHCGSNKALRRHENEHKCNKCNKVFDKVEYRSDHPCRGVANKKTVFECTNCRKSYTSRQCFINHLKVHNGTNQMTCQVCNKTFLHSLPFRKHMISHSEGTREQYHCEVCGDKFNLKIKYYAHCIRLSHSLQAVPHRCEVCQRLFSNERDLNSHCRVHYAEKPFKCGECEKTYSSKLGLKLHIDSIHLRQLRYQCEECNKRFAQPSHLSEHKRIHTAEKEFVCSFCGLHLSSKGSLRRHENRHTGRFKSSSNKAMKLSFARVRQTCMNEVN